MSEDIFLVIIEASFKSHSTPSLFGSNSHFSFTPKFLCPDLLIRLGTYFVQIHHKNTLFGKTWKGDVTLFKFIVLNTAKVTNHFEDVEIVTFLY